MKTGRHVATDDWTDRCAGYAFHYWQALTHSDTASYTIFVPVFLALSFTHGSYDAQNRRRTEERVGAKMITYTRQDKL